MERYGNAPPGINPNLPFDGRRMRQLQPRRTVDPTAPPMLRKMAEVVVCNPKILEYSAATDIDIEGCLSSRSECCCGDIRRAKQIEVEYQDVRGRVKKKRLKGFEARVFQHEYDHVEGVLHIDRQSPADRAKIQVSHLARS